MGNPFVDPVSPRIEALRRLLLDDIAGWTADPTAVHAALQEERFDGLLLRYLNHAHRFVAPRPRRVEFGPAFLPSVSNDLSENECVSEVLAEIATGADLTPRLSALVWTGAYGTKQYSPTRPRVRRWEDKDYALNAYGVHHLHLRKPGAKTKGRTTRLLFVRFSRALATIVTVGDHNSFDDGTVAKAAARTSLAEGLGLPGVLPGSSPGESLRSLSRTCGMTTLEVVDGQVALGARITTSGHSIAVRTHCNSILNTVAKFEPLLDDATYGAQLFARANFPAPDPRNLRWRMHYTDLLLVDVAAQTAVKLVHGLA